MAKEIFNRYENKFMLNEEQFENMKKVLDEHMVADQYNKNNQLYTITNVYYDTENNDIIRHSLSKPIYKEKVRLRAYGVPDKNDFVFIEIKKKFDGLVNKRRTKMKLYEAQFFLQTGIIIEYKDYMNKQVIEELKYYLKRNDVLPMTYIAYDRMAFFEKDNSDLRVTFDTNIRTRREDVDVSKGSFGTQLLEEGKYLMEVKSSKAVPLWLTHAMSEENIFPTSFSKYGTEYKNMLMKSQLSTFEEMPDFEEKEFVAI